MKEPTGP